MWYLDLSFEAIFADILVFREYMAKHLGLYDYREYSTRGWKDCIPQKLFVRIIFSTKLKILLNRCFDKKVPNKISLWGIFLSIFFQNTGIICLNISCVLKCSKIKQFGKLESLYVSQRTSVFYHN